MDAGSRPPQDKLLPALPSGRLARTCGAHTEALASGGFGTASARQRRALLVAGATA